jgi:hypothetical protein
MRNQRPSTLRKTAKSLALKAQYALHLEPRTFCLITGPPRSGTTALARWLLSQENVIGLNESRILVSVHQLVSEIHRFEDLYRERLPLEKLARRFALSSYGTFGVYFGTRVLVDKEPLEPIAFPDKDYRAFLRNLRTVFPGIRFLFLLRDPVPTIWSMTKRKWGFSLRNTEPVDFSLEEHIETWCSNVNAALEYADDSESYLCFNSRLVADPIPESRRISDFLGIKEGRPFEPRPTKQVGFDEEHLRKIRDATAVQVEALANRETQVYGVPKHAD